MVTVKRFPSKQEFKQLEYNSGGILSETTWSLLSNLTKADGVAAQTSSISGIVVPKKANPTTTPSSSDSSNNANCVCASMRPSASACAHLPYVKTYKCWLDKCPFCGGHLLNNPKGVYEGEWTCSKCNADFDGVCGAEKLSPPRHYLTPCPNTTKLSKLGNLKAGDGIKTKPSLLDVSGFGFNIPLNARINRISVLWNAWVKNGSGSETNVPTIPGVDIQIKDSPVISDGNSIPFYGKDKITPFSGSAIENITPEILNSKTYNLVFNPKRNTSANAGVMYLDYLALLVDYTNPLYKLAGTIKKVENTHSLLPGDHVTYQLTIKNINKADNGHVIPVNLTIPDGLTYVSNDGHGTYNPNTKKWTPILSVKGTATINIKFQATSSGSKTIHANIAGTTTTLNVKTSIQNPTYTFSSTLPGKIYQGKQFSYTITINSNDTLQNIVDVNVPIPDGFSFYSSDPSYDPLTQIWTAQFNSNQRDSVKLTLIANDPGNFTQTITTDYATPFTKTILVLPVDLEDCNYAEIALPDDLKVYLQDGVEYFISCNMEIISDENGSVYDGYNNFCISVLSNNEEEKDNDETFGTSPDNLNRFERVFSTFVYDDESTDTIRIYGQYQNLQAGRYAVKFNKWSISNLGYEYEDAGGLIDDPSLLTEDNTYAELSLDSGDSSKDIVLGNFNFAGRENDNDLIVKGLGVQIDYICTVQSTVTATITTGGVSSTQSIVLDPTGNTIEIGGETDKWDLNYINLEDITITFNVTNTSLDTVLIQLKNLQLNLYSKEDETNGNMGFTINDEHSRNYDIFLSNDGAKNEGLTPNITTYDLSNSEGELVSQLDLKAKKLTVKFAISGDSQEDAQELLKEASKFLANDLNEVGLPIPNVLVFDWDPTREYNVILSDEIKVTLDTFTYSCEADFLVPDGCGWNDYKTTGATDINEGLMEVRPLINILTNGGNVQIYDNVSNQSLTLNHDFDSGIQLIIDCDGRTVTDSDGNDYTSYITFNSSWPVIKNDFDFSNSTGCLIQTVMFKEGV